MTDPEFIKTLNDVHRAVKMIPEFKRRVNCRIEMLRENVIELQLDGDQDRIDNCHSQMSGLLCALQIFDQEVGL